MGDTVEVIDGARGDESMPAIEALEMFLSGQGGSRATGA